MKQHIKKSSKTKRTHWSKHSKASRPLFFAVLFGLVMVTYGISRLLAANPVIFTMTPAAQTKSAGQTATVSLQFNPNGNYIQGGSVRVNYDSNRLTFSKFTPAGGTPYTIYNQSSGTGYYSFNFYSNLTRQSASLGTLEFQAKPAVSTTQTTLSYAAANTRAYRGSIWNPSYYTVQPSGATVTIQVAAAPPPQPPTTTRPPTTTPPANQPPTPPITTPPEATPTPVAPETPGQETGDEETLSFDDDGLDVVAVAPVSKRPPFAALAALIGGVLLLGAAGLTYFIRLRPRRSGIKTPADLNSGLFDKGGVPATVAGAATQTGEEEPEPAKKEESEPVVEAPNLPVEQPDTTVKGPMPAENPPPPAATAGSSPPLSPADAVAQAALADLAANKPPTLNDAMAKEQASGMPTPPKPDWQHDMAQQSPVAANNEPEDMFELAKEHPESFGSSQLLEAEKPQEQPNTTKGKKA